MCYSMKKIQEWNFYFFISFIVMMIELVNVVVYVFCLYQLEYGSNGFGDIAYGYLFAFSIYVSLVLILAVLILAVLVLLVWYMIKRKKVNLLVASGSLGIVHVLSLFFLS